MAEKSIPNQNAKIKLAESQTWVRLDSLSAICGRSRRNSSGASMRRHLSFFRQEMSPNTPESACRQPFPQSMHHQIAELLLTARCT